MVVALGDFNGDGALDIVFGIHQHSHAGQTYENQVLLGLGDGNFNLLPDLQGTGHTTLSIALGHVNGDDYLDIVFGRCRGGVMGGTNISICKALRRLGTKQIFAVDGMLHFAIFSAPQGVCNR